MGSAADQWNETVGLYPDVTVRAALLRKGAATLTSHLWRNTEVIEQWAHAAGPWHDEDMLRMNTLATSYALDALREVLAGESSAEEAFTELAYAWSELMPTTELRERFVEDVEPGLGMWGETVDNQGLGRVLTLLTEVFGINTPTDWWMMPGYRPFVDELLELEPPEPGTFTERMLRRPWELSDEQARFAIDHRNKSVRESRRATLGLPLGDRFLDA